jgi:transglutaminase-like putative cysteine protease
MSERFLRWLVRRLRPARGWLLLLLAALMALLLPLSLESADWLRESDGLWLLALTALVTGAWLASRRRSRLALVLLALFIGGLLTVQWVSPFLPSLERLLTEAGTTRQWLAAGAPVDQVPWLGLLRDSVWQLAGAWRDVAVQGDRALLLRFVVALLVGSSSFWLAWWLFRGPGVRPWRAALPVGVLLATTAFFAVGQEYYLVFYLLTMLGLLAWGRWFQLERSWQDRGSDSPSDLGLDHATAAVVVSAAALLMILVVPQIVIQPAVNWFWQLVREPWAQVEQQAEALFPDVVRGSSGPLAAGNLRQGLPRAQLLGSGPEKRDIELFRVATSVTGASFIPRWRELTYAVYTGRGWQLEDEPALESVSVPAGRTWRRVNEPAGEQGGGALIEQRVESVQGSARLVVATGEPQAVSAGYRAVLRGPDDAVALELHDPQRRFTVHSLPAVASEEKLRIVNYSKTTPIIYLQTTQVPARVHELAANIVAPATNPYDQASRLEAYLRTLTYDLNVPLAGEDRDLVDAFLFDIRRGYCDYFASAFVVMARSVGLPARLAVGYASGREVAPGQWVVTEADAHSWPEVYFEEVGWIPFEPTPSQPPSSRPVAEPTGEVALTTPSGVLPLREMGLLVLSLGVLGGVVWLLLRAWRVPQNASETYARLAAWGTRLGQPPRPGDTMRGYAAAITGRVAGLTGDQSTERLARLIRAIVAWCEAALFAPIAERPAIEEHHRLWRQWQRTAVARGRLWVRQALRARHKR